MNGEDTLLSVEIVPATAKIDVPVHARVPAMTRVRERVVKNARDIVHLALTHARQHVRRAQEDVKVHALADARAVPIHVPAVQEPVLQQVPRKLCQRKIRGDKNG